MLRYPRTPPPLRGPMRLTGRPPPPPKANNQILRPCANPPPSLQTPFSEANPCCAFAPAQAIA